MPIDRFYSNIPLISGSEIVIEDEEFHHLSRVTRTREGDSIEIVNGKGQLGHAKVESIEKRRAHVQLLEVLESPLPRFETRLVLAIPRINRLDLIVEKGTELGMAELLLFPGEKSEKKELSENQLNRFIAISVAAMKQCGRLYLPAIKIFPPLNQWKTIPNPGYFGDVSQNAPLLVEEWNKNPPTQELYLFIGPESGFTVRELALLTRNNVIGVSMHQNILRTDTAAITALAIVNHLSLKTRE